jgi:predicted nucleotidyltransferase component of viral defense system
MGSLTSPHWETITPEMRELLQWAGQQDFMFPFYLAGGTALALQVGHRRSVDLDFFSQIDEVHERTRQRIIRAIAERDGQVIENVDGNLVLLVENIHVGFFSYGYKLLEPFEQLENVNVASVLDIGLMKLDAVIGRGSRKDFFDLYVIARLYSLEELLQAGARKYPSSRDFALMAVESFVLFENAERDVQPELMIDATWEEVREYFFEQAKLLGKKWFRK